MLTTGRPPAEIDRKQKHPQGKPGRELLPSFSNSHRVRKTSQKLGLQVRRRRLDTFEVAKTHGVDQSHLLILVDMEQPQAARLDTEPLRKKQFDISDLGTALDLMKSDTAREERSQECN